MRTLKRSVEHAMVGTGVPGLAISRSPRDVVLAYHNVVPEGERIAGDRSLHLGQRDFAAQLDWLSSRFEVVPLGEILAPRRGPRGRVAITFDDACRGALSVGIEELARRGLPATVFVPPTFVGGGSFWWDRYARQDGLEDWFRTHALERCRGEDGLISAWASSIGREEIPVPSHARCASESELVAACRVPGIQLGSHTWSHPNLERLTADEVREEIGRSLRWLRDRFHAVIPWLSYPYGKAPAGSEHLVVEAGYQGAVLVAGGFIRDPVPARYLLPRLNVPSGLSLAGLELRLSGLIPG